MDKKWGLNFGNLFYLIESVVGIGQSEIDECVLLLNKCYGLNYDFNKSNYCKIKRCERNMFQYIYDERVKFVSILCKQILKDGIIKIKFMNSLFSFCNDIAKIDEQIISKLYSYKKDSNIQEFLLCLIEVANYASNSGDSLFKERINISELLMNVSNHSKCFENTNLEKVPKEHSKLILIDAPTRRYSDDYVNRKEVYNLIFDILDESFNSIIFIYGLPGNGKTSLARKIFDDISNDSFHKIWFSAKLRSNELSLEFILNELLKSFGNDRPGLLNQEEKENEVSRLLCQKYICVLDDLEKSPEIDKILEFVLRFNEKGAKFGSKFILTCQNSPKKILKNVCKQLYSYCDINDIAEFIQIQGMSKSETNELVDKRIRKTTHLKHIVLNNESYLNKNQDILFVKTNGNPQAIRVAISYIENMIKSGNRLEDILLTDTIWDSDDIVKKMFIHMWGYILDDDSKRVIATIALIPQGISSERIYDITQIPEINIDGMVDNNSRLGRANNIAVDSSMIELRPAKESNLKPIYTKHGLVYDFIRKMLIENECPVIMDINESIIKWYLEKCENIGYCWNDIEKLKFLDDEFDVIYALIKRCYESQRYEIVLRFADSIRYYFLVRNIFYKNNPSLHQLIINSAQQLDDKVNLIEELVFSLNILSKRTDITNATPFYNILKENESTYVPLMNINLKCKYNHALALYYYAQKKYDYSIDLWKINESFMHDILDGEYNVYLRWMSKCYNKMGDIVNAKKYSILAFENSKENGFIRSRIDEELFMIELRILEFENNTCSDTISSEKNLIKQLDNISNDVIYINDKKQEAKWKLLYAKSLYCYDKNKYLSEIIKYANESYTLYGDIVYKEKQFEIKNWIDSVI